MHVLLADNELDTRQLLDMAFSFNGHQTTLVANGEQAVQATRDHRFDVIILDGAMPGLSGLQAASKIRKLPGGQEPLIAILTAFDWAEAQAKASGADLLIHKPVLPEPFVEAIERERIHHLDSLHKREVEQEFLAFVDQRFMDVGLNRDNAARQD
jgi:CheY-like chemotaxis protein